MAFRALLLASLFLCCFAADATAGWFQISRYGCLKTSEADVWRDLDKIYSKGKLDNLYRNPCNAFDLEFVKSPHACYAPLTSELDSIIGQQADDGIQSWYQNLPVGQRSRDPLAIPPGNMPR